MFVCLCVWLCLRDHVCVITIVCVCVCVYVSGVLCVFVPVCV